jgi:hypothetical protein
MNSVIVQVANVDAVPVESVGLSEDPADRVDQNYREGERAG